MEASPPAADLASAMGSMAYSKPFRRYQSLALDAVERGREAGRRRAYLVLPPGAGKTVIGLEIGRRLGQRVLALAPNSAIQGQWIAQWQEFAPPAVAAGASTSLDTPVVALTYQALCPIGPTHPVHTLPIDAAEADSGGPAATRSGGATEALHRDAVRQRRLVLRGGDRDEILSLLHPNGRRLLDDLRRSGPWTVILDECHHLLELWGHLVEALIESIGGNVYVLGLTATPPSELSADEARLYGRMFGAADLSVPTPAVVKEGNLAPYQELVYFTTPLAGEAVFLQGERMRWLELLDALLATDFAEPSFLGWLANAVMLRRDAHGAAVSWSGFEHDHQDLARAALRLLQDRGMGLPDGARLREEHRRPPGSDDWVALLSAYTEAALGEPRSPGNARAWEQLRAGLRTLGYVLTSSGVRAHVAPADRVVALSASKAAASLDILAVEHADLGERLRALVICDFESAAMDGTVALRGVLDSAAGSAALLLRLLVADPVGCELDPMLMTGRSVACSAATATRFIAFATGQVPDLQGQFRPPSPESVAESPDAVVTLDPGVSWWGPRNYVPLVTAFYEKGGSRCLVGTRGLLGEGWDARGVNVLIDLTAAGTRTAVHQLRGRSLRLDPDWPGKVANNWEVVCVAAEHPRGTADYERFARKHRAYYALNGAGEVERGVSHVDAELSPFGPPPSERFEALNRRMRARAAARAEVYERWRVGEPYENVDMDTVRIRLTATPPGSSRAGERARISSLADLPEQEAVAGLHGLRRRVAADALVATGLVAGSVVLHALVLGVAAAAIVAGAGGAWTLRSARRVAARAVAPEAALERFAAAVATGLVAGGGVRADLGARSVRLKLRDDGLYQCELAGATSEEARLFADSLDELLSPLTEPRYMVPRRVVRPVPPSAYLGALVRPGRVPPGSLSVVYHAVPSWLGTNRQRADHFAAAWNRHVSAGAMVAARSPEGAGILAAQRGEDVLDATTEMRTTWR